MKKSSLMIAVLFVNVTCLSDSAHNLGLLNEDGTSTIETVLQVYPFHFLDNRTELI